MSCSLQQLTSGELAPACSELPLKFFASIHHLPHLSSTLMMNRRTMIRFWKNVVQHKENIGGQTSFADKIDAVDSAPVARNKKGSCICSI
jgi:hypothetical protein